MDKLLESLSGGSFHSGESLGKSLGVSRSAIWKQLKALENMGLEIHSVRGKGYRLAKPVERLNVDAILSTLNQEQAAKISLHTCLTIDSTNDWVRELSATNSGKTCYGIAEYQSKGRGRRGKTWNNPIDSTVSMSVCWRPPEGSASLEGLSLVVGYAIVKALEDMGIEGLQLKWPNDVLWSGKKLCGILLELHGDPTSECEVIIGVGLNIDLSNQQLLQIDRPATDVTRILGKSVSRNQVIGLMITHMTNALDQFPHQGFSGFQERWSAYDAFRKRDVCVQMAKKEIYGRYLGVNDHGGLLVETASGVTVFHGGEVSLRKA